MKCRAEKGTFVWPIFYRLDPADVGFQRKSFGEAFEKHEQRYEEETIQEWKSASKEASKISGWHITYGTVEITIVNDIVQSVSTKLGKLREDDTISNIRSNIREVDELIKDQVTNMYLWPKALEVPIMDPAKDMKIPVGILIVKVLRATRLKKKDLVGAPDPYVKLKLTDDKPPSKKTTVKYKSLNPEWN
ncbi:hypothetical protein RIF29_21309 [Crotalaria pallida]|uniref:C2 domain-containing protein n=1 Tax=Crotalaria pallida TaxID=3830 RepID=A0AAN9F2J1_CROPI